MKITALVVLALLFVIADRLIQRFIVGSDDEDSYSDRLSERLPHGLRIESGIILLVYTTKTSLFDKIAELNKKFWIRWNTVGAVAFGISSVVTLGLFVLSLYSLLFTNTVDPETASTITNPKNALAIPVVNDFLPVYEVVGVITAIVVGMVVHEGGHGIAARIGGLPTKETGLGFLLGVIPIAAYVEIPKEKIREAPLRHAVFILVAGVMNNFVVAGITLVALLGFTSLDPLVYTLQLSTLNAPNLPLGVSILYWTFFINLNLGMFNTLPIYGLDGGEVVKKLERDSYIPEFSTRLTTGVSLYILASIYAVAPLVVF